MSARLLERPNDCLSPQTTNADQTVTLARTLIRHVMSTADPAAQADPDAPDILLDTEVDGVRCMLVRLHPRHAHQAQALLSPREQEIARMVATGYPNKTIAAVLDISSWTVGTHLRRVFAKLGVGSRAAMVARLHEDGLLKHQAKPADPFAHERK